MKTLSAVFNSRKSCQGVSLIIAVFSMMLLGILGMVLAMMISGDFEMNSRDLESEQAFHLADAGIQEAVSRLRANSTLFDTDAKWLNRKLGNGEYNVSRLTNGTQITLVSSAYVPAQANYRTMRQVKLKAQFGAAFGLGNAVYSTGNVTMSGNSNVNNGNITAGGNVNLGGNSEINAGNITQNAPVVLPAVVVPDPPLNSPSSGTLSVSGNNSVTLASGNYKYSSISLSSNGVLTINGPANIYLTGSPSFTTAGNAYLVLTGGAVNIYVDGAVSIAGNGVIGNSANIDQLIIYGTSNNHSTVTLSGNGYFYGVIYAPTMNLAISGNGSYYGSYVGSGVTMTGNASIYYDPSLSSVFIQGGGGLNVFSWQEQ